MRIALMLAIFAVGFVAWKIGRTRIVSAVRDYGGLVFFWFMVTAIFGNAILSATEP